MVIKEYDERIAYYLWRICRYKHMIYKILKVHLRNIVGIYAPEVVKALTSIYR